MKRIIFFLLAVSSISAFAENCKLRLKAITLYQNAKCINIIVLLMMTSNAFAIGNGEKVDSSDLVANSIVAIHYRNGSINEFCTGSIISNSYILTAAHCVIDKRTQQRRDIKKINVLLGLNVSGYLLGASNVDGVTEVKVVKATTFSESVKFSVASDVAVLKLAKKLPRSFKKVILDQDDLTVNSDQSSELVSYGYGLTKPASTLFTGTHLTKGFFTSTPIPQNDLTEFFNSSNEDMFVHMNSSNDQSICSGDSGGPTFKLIDDKYVQVGITHGSTNKAGAHLGKCPNEESYVTKVSPFYHWIAAQIK